MTDKPPRGTYLVRRNYVPRMIGVVLCAVCLVCCLVSVPFNSLHWLLAPYFVLIWPQLAYWWAMRAANPLRAELINLWVDSVHAGFWIAAIQFSFLPTVAILMATSLSNITVGSLRFMLIGFTGHAAGMVVGVLVWGAQVNLQSDLLAQAGTAVLIVCYPLLMGQIMHQLAMQLKYSKRELHYLSLHDPLSGVHNRRHLDQTLQFAFRRFLHTHEPTTLLICDVDDFKQINDQHGHATGDEVIRQLGAALSLCARSRDTVARLGGDEFVVLLDGTPAEQARAFTQRIQATLDERLHASHPGLKVQLSFGMASAASHMRDAAHWLATADALLYEQKAARHLLR